MFRSTLVRSFLAISLAIGPLAVSTQKADAGWWHWRCHSGWGCYAPVYRPVWGWFHWRAHWRAHLWGGYGCPTVSYGYDPYVTSCYDPCSVCCYDPCCCTTIDWGGTVVQEQAVTQESTPAQPPDQGAAPTSPTLDSTTPEPGARVPADEPPSLPAFDEPPASSSNRAIRAPGTGDAILSVTVPEDARVFVNGRLTRTPGALRRYVSRGLAVGESYTYEVHAELNRDGRRIDQTKLVQLRAGQTTELGFGFTDDQVATTLTVSVPEDATVTLAGRPTRSTGSFRAFATRALAVGERWDDYRVVVTVERDGRRLTQERKVTLIGGAPLDLEFDFSAEQVAMR